MEIIRNLPKHTKYHTSYKAFDYYWGLGIEHETYIKTSQTKLFTNFQSSMKAERYSVSYYKVYDPSGLEVCINKVMSDCSGRLLVPVLMNSHSFQSTDKYGQHKTTYEKNPKTNPKYEGKTFFDWACEHSKWLREEYEKSFMWDGDSIEFMTQHFYKTTLSQVMKELKEVEGKFEKEISTLPKQGQLVAYSPLQLVQPDNPPFASFLTNPKNIAMFNNGTIHINISLPTRLALKEPLFWNKFVEDHRRLAICIQWLEPFWIAMYGSGDPLEGQAKGSQRLAVSRYIGVGTFDVERMPRGKILQVKKRELYPLPWYDTLYMNTIYQPLEDIGLDINFNKHGSHGLELRFFDQMPFSSLERVLEEIILVADISLQSKNLKSAVRNKEWQEGAMRAIKDGNEWMVSTGFLKELYSVFGLQEEKFVVKNIQESYREFFSKLPRGGECWMRMVEGRKKSCFW